MTLLTVPTIEYPIMYRAFESADLDQTKRVKYVTAGNPYNSLVKVFATYYDLILNPTTLTQVSYTFTSTPYSIVFIVVYMENDTQNYIWEYLPIWSKIKQLNQNNKLF